MQTFLPHRQELKAGNWFPLDPNCPQNASKSALNARFFACIPDIDLPKGPW